MHGSGKSDTHAETSRFARLSQLLRERGPRAMGRHVRTVALHRLHEQFIDKSLAQSEAVSTAGRQELDSLTITSARVGDGHHYLGTPTRVLDWIAAELPIDRAKTTFLDIGCGRGRAMAWAARHGFTRVHGIEFASELAADARLNLERVAISQQAATLTVDCADATQAKLPEGPLLVYLFNPFGAETLRAFLSHLGVAQANGREQVHLVYVNPAHLGVVADMPGLVRCPVSRGFHLKLSVASPYDVALFSSRG